MTPTPPRSRVEAPRWYSVTRDGAATLCVDEDDARQVASESDVAWPRMGPHRAVQLVDASAIAELEQECERLRKALSLVQQHHATAWNRGHMMGMEANRQIAKQAQEAVASDAWGNTQLTEALMKAEAECEALRKDAGRYALLRRGQRWSVVNGIGDTLRADTLDSAIDAALAAQPEKG